MNSEEKISLARLLDLTSDYLKDGHRREREDYKFETEVQEQTALPLAYMIEEPEEGEAEDILPPGAPAPIISFLSANDHKGRTIETIAAEISICKACGLAATRKKTVPGEGVLNPLVMVIGEGPGADEDAAGRPFVGRAGQLLDRMLSSIGLSRSKNCFIANMVKCRPPGNRDPGPDEIAACYPFLEHQILFIQPQVILCAGRVAAQNLLKTGTGINALRGKFMELKIAETVIPVLPTFHPSALLRDDNLRRPAWEDLKLLRARLASLSEEYSSSLGKTDG